MSALNIRDIGTERKRALDSLSPAPAAFQWQSWCVALSTRAYAQKAMIMNVG